MKINDVISEDQSVWDDDTELQITNCEIEYFDDNSMRADVSVIDDGEDRIIRIEFAGLNDLARAVSSRMMDYSAEAQERVHETIWSSIIPKAESNKTKAKSKKHKKILKDYAGIIKNKMSAWPDDPEMQDGFRSDYDQGKKVINIYFLDGKEAALDHLLEMDTAPREIVIELLEEYGYEI